MGADVFALLLGFALVKMAIAGAILWAGLRTGETPPDDGDGRGEPPLEPPPPPPPPHRRAARRTPRTTVRGRPTRRPSPRVAA